VVTIFRRRVSTTADDLHVLKAEATMVHAAFLMPLFPLVGFAVLLTLGRRIGDPWPDGSAPPPSPAPLWPHA